MKAEYIMVTRPTQQADQLIRNINKQGGKTFSFPTLEILPIELSQIDKEKIHRINQYDIIIFISANAVQHGITHIRAITKLTNDPLLATIGASSSSTLKDLLGKAADIVPAESFNSEGLLATSAFQDVNNKRILIIRGNGGREHLKQCLQKRGALVEYITVYRRVKPQLNTTVLKQYLQNKQIAAIVITSAEGLRNLVKLTPKEVLSQILQVTLLLINNRLLNIAKEVGFDGKIIVTSQASDSAIIKSLETNHLLQ